MIELFMKNLLRTSLVGSIAIVIILISRKALLKKYTSAFNYYIWLAIIVKIIIPFKISIHIPEKIYNVFQYSPYNVKSAINNRIYLNAGIKIENSTNLTIANYNIESYFIILFYIWLIVLVIFLAYHIISYIIFNNKIKYFICDVSDNRIKSIYSKLLTGMNIKKKISLKFCRGISTPLGIGIFKSHILIPVVSYSTQEIECILKHELMHYKRHDMLYKILVLITVAIHWFNPLVYIMCKSINDDCELSCDEAVLKKLNTKERKLYASTLVNSLRLNKSNVVNQNLTTGFNNKDILKRRLENMLNLKIRKKGIIIAALTVIITISSLISINIFAKNNVSKGTVLTTNEELLQPQQVVENYFKYYNEKNEEGVASTLTEWLQGSNIDKNVRYIKIDSISQDVRPLQKEAYMKYGRGSINGVKEDNIKIYKVEYTVKNKKDGISPRDSGNYTWWFYVIRKDINSPWLIDDMGEG